IRFHKSIIKEKTVDIIHKMDFVYSLEALYSHEGFLILFLRNGSLLKKNGDFDNTFLEHCLTANKQFKR
ncbi:MULTISPECIES: hypothetical protein, partial [Enterococcus]|uniref:hypothetical protein n=1 Tax=Enterococcus TaxID=1350 RepID=UPI0034A1FCB4